MKQERLVPDLFIFKKAQYEVKASGLQLNFNIFQQPSIWHTIKTTCMKLQTINSEICSILIFQKRVWDQFPHHILRLIFQEKCFSFYILLTDQISLPDCFYFSRYWAISVLQLFVNQALTTLNLKLTLSFLSSHVTT